MSIPPLRTERRPLEIVAFGVLYPDSWFLSNVLETLLKNVLLCDLMTAFARFPKYWLSLIRYSTSKSFSFMFNQNLIETAYAPVVINIS